MLSSAGGLLWMMVVPSVTIIGIEGSFHGGGLKGAR